MKYLFIIVSIIILSVSDLKAVDDFRIKLSLAKTTFIVGERVDLGLEIKNISHNTIKGDFNFSVRIQLFDNLGNKLPWEGITGDIFSPFLNEFKPGEEFYKCIELNDFWGKKFNLRVESLYYDPGKYSIVVTFNPPNMKEIKNSIFFQVNKPSGEEAIVFNEFLQVYRDFKKFSRDSDYPEALYALHLAHPNSVYSPILLDLVSSYYSSFLKDPEKAGSIDHELVEKYPWSGLSQGMIRGILRKMPSNKERKDYITKILPQSKHYPNQKVLEKLLIDLNNNKWR